MSSKEDSSLTDWKIVSIKLLAQNTIRPFLEIHQVKDNCCSICRNSFDENSLNNKSRLKKDPLVIGKCTHCFHECCINNWLKEQPTCPICAVNWQVLIKDTMSGIKDKLSIPPASPIIHSAVDYQGGEIKEEAKESSEGKSGEFGLSWDPSEAEFSAAVESSQQGWTDVEVVTDTDDDMPELVE